MRDTDTPAESSGHGARDTPYAFLVGPLIGLAYVLALPLIGAALLVYFLAVLIVRQFGKSRRNTAQRGIRL